MDLIMTIIGWIVWLVVGSLVGAFFVAQPIIVLVFGIPFGCKMRKIGVLKSSAPLIMYLVALLIQIAILATITWVAWRFFPKYLPAYIWTALICPALSFRKLGATRTNVQEFFENNAQYMDADAAIDFLSKHYSDDAP
jgi:hypothetical protein